MAYTINLIPTHEEHFCLEDCFCVVSVLSNVTNYLDDENFRLKNGQALMDYIDNKVDLTTEADHLYEHGLGLVTALQTVAAITPLSEKNIQIDAAEKIRHILKNVNEETDTKKSGYTPHKYFQETELNSLHQDHNSWAKMYNYLVDTRPACYNSDITAKRIDNDFQKTLSYQVCAIYQDNTIATRDEKHIQAQAVIAAYKNDGVAIQ